MIFAITGIRDLHLDSHQVVHCVLRAFVSANPEATFLFGGARGVDTIALIAASNAGARTKVIVPFTVAQQPKEAQDAIVAHAHDVMELKLNPKLGRKAFLYRNEALIHPANCVLGFTDGKFEGGTFHAMTLAKDKNKDLVAVLVRSIQYDPLERP
jgi:predicted Rossmann fold nucleotide-binding protein DprA/Smf involved in DNA uptake